MKVLAITVTVVSLAWTMNAQAQVQKQSSPSGAALPSAQQTTGRAADVGGRPDDRPQSPVGLSSGNVTHSDEQAKGLVPGNTAADGGEARNQGR